MFVSTTVPPDWLWAVLLGGYKALGTELNLSNADLHAEGIVEANGESFTIAIPCRGPNFQFLPVVTIVYYCICLVRMECVPR